MFNSIQSIMNNVNFTFTCLIIGLYFLLRNWFESKIDSLISITPFDSIKQNYLSDIIIFLFLLIYLFYFFNTLFRKFKKWNSHFYFLHSILLIYLFYRFIDTHWYFTRFKSISFVAYSDLIIIYISFHYLNSVVNNKIKRFEINNEGFILDKYEGIDLAARKEFAKIIIDKILNTNSNASIAIGIIGKYGSGKSVFIDFLEQNIDTNSSIIVKFNPWSYSNSSLLVEKFFNEFSVKFKFNNFNLFQLINEYSNNFINNNKLISLFNSITDPIPNSMEKQLKEINNYLDAINKRVFVFIDDLDRLDNK